jgi:hypothetical protein
LGGDAVPPVAEAIVLMAVGAFLFACAYPVLNDWRGVASRSYAIYKRIPVLGPRYGFPLFHFSMVAPFPVMGLFFIVAGVVRLARS